ncbi:kinetochore scaffold 1 [Sigmodon hispidus]
MWPGVPGCLRVLVPWRAALGSHSFARTYGGCGRSMAEALSPQAEAAGRLKAVAQQNGDAGSDGSGEALPEGRVRVVEEQVPGSREQAQGGEEQVSGDGERAPAPVADSGRWVGRSLMHVFSTEFRAQPLTYYEAAVRAGRLHLNEEPVQDLNIVLKDNDFLRNTVHRHEPPVTAEPIRLLTENEDVVVIDKPSSIPVHPCGRFRHNTVIFILGKEHQLKELHPLHRLDRLTSGVLMFAKTAAVSEKIHEQVRDRQLEKEYVCRVKGEFPDKEVICKEPILVVSYKIGVCRVDPRGKPCETVFQRLSYNGHSSVVQCRPLTGRTHQIRVHLQFLGHPVLNDPIYNSTAWGPSRGQGGHIPKTDEELLRDLVAEHQAKESLNVLDLCEGDLAAGLMDSTAPSSELVKDSLKELATVSQKIDGVAEATSQDLDTPEKAAKTDVMNQETDPLCSECRLSRQDPLPQDLVMFLHALRYKGPDFDDNIQKPVRRRHSSILKPPRSPLQDLKFGNETVQESNVPRTRKSSRRVSFADTIKVFQTESHMKTERNSEISETEARRNVLTLQNKNLDDNYCTITGMNTLLCAPIQTQKQQKEFPVIDYNHERKHANDQTVIFSDENQMDLTASHTVMISKGLSDCTQSKNFTKIDTTSFLENLKHHIENSRIKKELEFSTISTSQNNFSENINSDFIKRLKTEKYSISLDKENSEIPIFSKESNSASSTHQMHASLNVDENNSNRTRIFREQDDGMNLTECHTASIQTWNPPSREDNLGGFKDDTTIYGNECMELTANYTIQVLPSENNLSERETETQNVMMNVTTVDEMKVPQKKTVLKDKLNTAFQDSFSNPENKIHITKSHNMESETHTVTQTFNQGASTLAETSKSIWSSPTIQGYKTIFYSSNNDAMELTNCLLSVKEEENLLKPDGNYSKVCTSSNAVPLIEKTIYSEEDNMDITKSHTVVIDNEIFKQDQENIKKEITAIPIFKKETMLQNHVTMSEDEKMNVNYIKVPQVSKERLQQSLTNISSVSLADKRIELLADEDMDLTKSHTSKLSQGIPTTFDLASKSVTKSYSHSKSSPDEWEKMTKSLTQPFQPRSIISQNILTDNQRKEKHPILEISSCLDQKYPLSVDYNQDITTNHNISSSGTCLDVQVSQGHTVQDQNSKLLEPQRKNLDGPTPDCSRGKIISSEEEQTMDLTKSHTIVIGFGPSEIQEQSKTNLDHTNSQFTTVNRQIDANFPVEKTRVVTTNDMDILKDRTIQKPEFLKEKQNVKMCGRKSAGGLKLDKTILFSEGNENDMDITRSYTVKINHRSLLDKYDSHLVPVAGTSKTILYACGQDEMEITRSHTTALECKIISPNEITPSPLDKTVTSIEGHEELEMTKSHTIFIDYQVEAKSVLPDTLGFELSKKECLQKPKGMSTPAEEINHPSAKGSQLTVVEERFNSGPRKDTNDDPETSKLATWKNDKNVQNPGFLNELSDKTQRRKSLRLNNNKTTTFPENDNNRDTTQSSVVIIHETSLEDGEDFSVVPLAGTSKPVLSAHRPEDMEISRSQITASEYKTDPADKISTMPMDKTVMFVDNLGDLDVTKSHTVFIDCQAKEKELHEHTKLGMARTEHLNGPEGDTCIQKVSDPIVSPNVSCFSIVKPSLSNLNRKAEEVLDFETVHVLPPVEQLLEAGNQAHNHMSTVQATGMSDLGFSDGRDEDSKNLHDGVDTTSVSLKTAVKDKTRRCSLGIFLPKLPNKRNCSITGVDDLKLMPADATDLNCFQTQPVSSKDSGITSVAARLNLSPSQYINEENLPIWPDEILSSDSVSLDIDEKAQIDTDCREILPSENKIETCSAKKRTWVQEEDNVTNEKKIRTHNSIQDQEIFDHSTEGDVNKNVNSVLMKSLSRTPSSCSSDQDSIKTDGISPDISTQRNSQMESQFLSDSICEESLREKLKNGQITIKEFFILLQVHILIQKPRQSNLPAKFTINTSPTPEDLMLRQYVYGPKTQIYREDCELLRQKIEELKVSALNQDKLLTDVNRNLWEKVKDYSDEELKTYGIYLNKIKSRYTKMTKVFTHQGKVALYNKLVHSAENETKKLQIKINEMDNILKKINNCLTEVEIETRNLENEEKHNPMEAWDSEIEDAEKELEQLRTEEEELQRKFLEVETQKTQTLAQIEFTKEQTNKTEELLDHLSLSEWDVIEWSDDQAIFTFVYDTIELTFVFGEPVVGLPFLDKPNRKINELNFQSLLDEDKAPPSSILVHRLIFQYIEEQESWKKKCTTQHQVPQMLQELSQVVNHCRLLGEEIEFLKRWGPNYSLMDINVNNNELRLLFSSCAAFAKFEITLSLSTHYPLVPLQFTIQNHLGNIGHDEIAATISKVPLEDNYLKNVVKQIYQDLLKN